MKNGQLSRVVLGAIIEWSDLRVGDVEGNAYRRVLETQPDTTQEGFDLIVESLLVSGHLARTRAKRDGAGEIVGRGMLVPTPKGRIEVSR